MDAYGIDWELDDETADLEPLQVFRAKKVVRIVKRPRWVQPLAVEIRMDAEIGSYQMDDEREREPVTP